MSESFRETLFFWAANAPFLWIKTAASPGGKQQPHHSGHEGSDRPRHVRPASAGYYCRQKTAFLCGCGTRFEPSALSDTPDAQSLLAAQTVRSIMGALAPAPAVLIPIAPPGYNGSSCWTSCFCPYGLCVFNAEGASSPGASVSCSFPSLHGTCFPLMIHGSPS